MITTKAYVNEEYPCSRCIHDGDEVYCHHTGLPCGTPQSPSGAVKKPTKWQPKYGKKIYDNIKVPDTLRDAIYAIIADYDRRKKEIESGMLNPTILEQYANINRAIDMALCSIEEFYRYFIFSDIVEKRGFNFSFASQTLSRRAYHRRKRLIIATVAQYLNLI